MSDPFIPHLIESIQKVVTSFSSSRVEETITAIFLIVVGFFFARLMSRSFLMIAGARLSPHQQLLWRRGIFYFLFIIFAVAALREVGLKLSVLLGAAGILTVAIGFAAQTSASNLISGLFLIGEGSFAVGDTIQITLIRGHTLEGEVVSIDLLSVKLLTLDNLYIRLPNEQLIRAPVINLSRFPIRRIPIHLFIAFDEDIVKVREVLLNVAQGHPLVLDEPCPAVNVTAFRESTIELSFEVWCCEKNFFIVRDEIHEAVRNDFVENKIEIPVPKIGLVDPKDIILS